ncbi:MAG: hypothetical protein VB099_18650 [Candidatus Limiplasma sp.]|nr:hypothetical protein [Candidatus Limiplasma sp.]
MTDHELALTFNPKLLAMVIDRDQTKRLEELLREKRVFFHYMFHGMGTANSEMLKAFGLSGSEKTVCVCIEPAFQVKPLMTALVERMELTRPGNGIAFIIPISGVSTALSGMFTQDFEEHRERWIETMDREMEHISHDIKYELVIAVVNQGYSEEVIDVAHASGARGGTIIHARRAGAAEASKFFGISVQEEKEIVAILMPKNAKKELMQAISKACGLKSEARGIVFSLPVESCAGLALEEEK